MGCQSNYTSGVLSQFCIQRVAKDIQMRVHAGPQLLNENDQSNSVCHYAVIVAKRLIFQIMYCITIWCDPTIEEVLRLYVLHCEATARMNFDACIIWYELKAYQLHNAMLCCPLDRMSQHWHPFRVASPQRIFCWSQQQHPKEWCLVCPCRLCQHHRPVVSLQLQYLLLWLRLADSQSLAARWRQSIKSQGHERSPSHI